MRAVVLVSGGMDSLVTAAKAVDAGRECAFLHVTYGQRTAARERRAFEEIADHYHPYKRLVADISYLADIGGSALTDLNIAVPNVGAGLAPPDANAAPTFPPDFVGADPRVRPQTDERDVGAGLAPPDANASRTSPPDSVGAGLAPPDANAAPTSPPDSVGADPRVRPQTVPATYVPFRNAHLVAIAASLAEVEGAEEIHIGATQVDYSGYPDCRREFFDAFEKTIDLGTKPETHVKIVTPLIDMSKADIIREGLRLEVPFELSWSCYAETEVACGKCESCRLRLRGFAEAGAADPVPYAQS